MWPYAQDQSSKRVQELEQKKKSARDLCPKDCTNTFPNDDVS